MSGASKTSVTYAWSGTHEGEGFYELEKIKINESFEKGKKE